jgi:phage terminase large subunit-like protein
MATKKLKPVSTMTRGEKVCAFIEAFCLAPEGEHIGKPIVLEDFQRRFLLDIYDNPLGTHTAILSIARKNGKTALIGGMLLAHLCGPEAVQNSQIVSGAQSKEQAAVVFELARKMVDMSPKLSKLVRIQPSGKRLIGLSKNVSYRALSAEGKTAHGLSPILAILDETGQVVGPTDKFVSAITSAQGAYQNPLLITISTQAPTDADMLSTWIDAQKNAPDPRVVCHVYSAPADCELDDRKAWAAANPAMGKFRSIGDIEKQCHQAMEMPANEPEFRNLILNQRVEAVSPFVSGGVWKENGTECGLIDGKKVWGGLDLSSVHDLTALELVTDDGGVHSEFWLPKEGLAEKSRKDRVPYDLWAKQGHLNTTPGRAIEYEYIAEFLRGLFDRCDVQKLAFDRYNMVHLLPWLVKAGFTEDEIAKFHPFGQGTASMTPALRELEVKLLGRQLRHSNHPILEMCAKNATVVGDSGARKFDKRKQTRRIDGMVALAMAVGVMPFDGVGPSVYEERGIRII